MEESKVVIDMNSVIDQAVTELDKMLDEAKKYILSNEMFIRYVVQFQQAAAQLINIISTPAIKVTDIQGNVHFIVAGEKWKLFMAAQFFYSPNGNEGQKVINCTNPITYTYDTFTITKNEAISALNNYEEVYDISIKNVMDINDKVSSLSSVNSNTDKLNILREVVGMIRKSIETNREIYKTAMSGH